MPYSMRQSRLEAMGDPLVSSIGQFAGGFVRGLRGPKRGYKVTPGALEAKGGMALPKPVPAGFIGSAGGGGGAGAGGGGIAVPAAPPRLVQPPTRTGTGGSVTLLRTAGQVALTIGIGEAISRGWNILRDAVGRLYATDPASGTVAYIRKRRRMNPLNPRALRRALTRVKGFERFARRSISVTKRVKVKRRRR